MRYAVVTGLLVLAASVPMLGQIPPGYELVGVSSGPHLQSRPKINDCGEIVFSIKLGSSWADSEVFLYDNGKLTQITDNDDRDVAADINDDGTIVWSRGIGDAGVTQVVRYENGETTILADGTPEHPALVALINNLGHIVWHVCDVTECPPSMDIVFWDGMYPEVLVSDGLSNQVGGFNDHDELAWTRYHNTCPPSVFWTAEIMLYSGGQITVLPATPNQPQCPDINNAGQVVWKSRAGTRILELWEDGQVTLLTDWGSNPRINDHGEIYFIRFHDDIAAWQPWLYHPGPEPTFYRLVEEPVWNTAGDINEAGECAWEWAHLPESYAGGIRFLRRIRDGDVDFNDDVNIDDFADLPGCLTGPAETDHLCECRFYDIDHDRDVDLTDFASFQNRFGMQPSRDCCIPHDSPGCTEPAIEDCVCDVVYLCCQPGWGWDEYCVSLVEILGCGTCP